MRSMTKFRSKSMIALASLVIAAGSASAQQDVASFPSRPIRLIVGFGAGGGNDLLARIVGQKLSENIGQPVVIENKPGAGGRLAIDYAQSQPADGTTVIIGATGQLAISTAIYPKLSFHPTRTLTPLTMIASYPLIISGPVNDTIKSVKDLVAWGKTHPDQSNYPTSSPAFTIPTELFKLKTGMPAQAISYKSTNEMMLSVVGGQTLFAIADPASTVPLAKAGKIRALAINRATRSAELPDMPTMAEIGLADIDIRLQWGGAFVTAGTPPAIAAKLETELRRVLADAAVREKIRAINYDPGGGPGEEYRRLIDDDIKAYAEVVKAANLTFD
jgi:tripartite-type tricarboxylate transporter receptor subunit TctC